MFLRKLQAKLKDVDQTKQEKTGNDITDSSELKEDIIIKEDIVIKEEKDDSNKSKEEIRREKIMLIYNNRDNPEFVKKETKEWLKTHENDLFFLGHLVEAQWNGKTDEKNEADKMADYILTQEPKDNDDICGIVRIYSLRQEFDKFFPLVEKGAKDKHPICLCHMGWAYSNGRGCQKDITLSKKYYQESIDVGGPLLAYYNLALQLEIEGDIKGARSLYLKASKSGYKAAIGKLLVVYSNEESKEAFEFFEMICNIKRSGTNCSFDPNGSDYYKLGNFYFYGKFTEQNFKKARECWENGKKQNHQASKDALNYLNDNQHLL